MCCCRRVEAGFDFGWRSRAVGERIEVAEVGMGVAEQHFEQGSSALILEFAAAERR